MTIPLPHWERYEAIEQINIPAPDGKSVPTTIQVKVPAWRDPVDGEIYFDGDSIRIIDDARARAMGLLTTDELKSLRINLGLTQQRLCQLLKIGEKTWTRWEAGRDRPSKSLNVMICALRDGKIDVPYLERLASGQGQPEFQKVS
ncbi:MAG: helix-turn-helix domain-containing protein [Verrucomicrobia bacterium]|nr:helix-turn-helix domain-containing protein [Verrucomicrobiota bacterium]